MLVTQSHCSLTPHFGPFLLEEKKNWKKRNFFSATVQGLSQASGGTKSRGFVWSAERGEAQVTYSQRPTSIQFRVPPTARKNRIILKCPRYDFIPSYSLVITISPRSDLQNKGKVRLLILITHTVEANVMKHREERIAEEEKTKTTMTSVNSCSEKMVKSTLK